ncbi:MAG: DUF881 domain-containing protein [Sporichthyaceae bacterium]|jgi:uncharacterized protein YlxW (UPF0749 family)
MSLLADLTRDTIDSGYRRPDAPRPEVSRSFRFRSSVTMMLIFVVAGAVLGTAAGQTRVNAQAVSAARNTLIERVTAKTAEADELERRVLAERAGVDATRSAALALTEAGSAAGSELERLALLAGTTAVRGPGIRVVVDDAPNSSVRGEGSSGRIRDSDLQRLLNGLWLAGAEAVSINNQRLTTLTAVRSAGDAILVAYRPLSPPYEVLAIGKANDLEVDFVDGPGGRWFHTLTGFGIRFSVTQEQNLTLPGAAGSTLRSAEEKLAP